MDIVWRLTSRILIYFYQKKKLQLRDDRGQTEGWAVTRACAGCCRFRREGVQSRPTGSGQPIQGPQEGAVLCCAAWVTPPAARGGAAGHCCSPRGSCFEYQQLAALAMLAKTEEAIGLRGTQHSAKISPNTRQQGFQKLEPFVLYRLGHSKGHRL